MPGNTPASAIAAPAVAGLWPAHCLSPCRRFGLCGLHRQSACGLQRAVAGGRPAVCGPGGGCFAIPPLIKSLQAGCGPVVAGMPACQTCRPTVWNGTSGFVVRPVMPGVSRRLATCCGQGCFRGMACPEKSITPMGCGPWPWLVACCLTVARRCMPSVTCFSPLPSLLAVRSHRRAVPSGISPCQSLWP